MTPSPHSRPAECAAFEQAVQAVLDREAPVSALGDSHAASCAACRDLAASARLLLAGLNSAPPPTPSPDLTNCILAAVVLDYRSRQRRWLAARVAGSLVAASLLVLVAVWFTREAGNQPPPVAIPTPAPSLEQPPVRVADQFAEAGSALASMTRNATERAIPPSAVVPTPEVTALPRVSMSPEVEPAAESLTALSEGAQSGLQPMADTTRRAVNLFLRDFSFVSTAKPKS